MFILSDTIQSKICSYLSLPLDYFELFRDNIIDDDGFIVITEHDGVFYKCINPSVLYIRRGHLPVKPLKIDEYSKLLSYSTKVKQSLLGFNNSTADNIAQSLELLLLPKNQTLIDMIVKDNNYLDVFISNCRLIYNYCVDVLNNPSFFNKFKIRTIA